MRQDNSMQVALADKVKFLASAVEEPPPIETHMSWVFVGRERVFKLKKPVRYVFLDFSTLAARELNCRAEVQLNRRLAPDVYLGVAPLLRGADGRFSIGAVIDGADHAAEESNAGTAQVVDWLVVMRPLPRERMLDAALRTQQVTAADIDRLADTLSAFYRRAPVVVLEGAAYVKRLLEGHAINRAALGAAGFRDLAAGAVLEALERALQVHHSLLAARADGGHLREGHGDLRPEHICLLDHVATHPVVIDCLEFNLAFRQVDPFDELAYLDLECRLLDAPWIGPRVLARCALALDDAPPPAVTAVYTAYRALVRARLALAHLLERDARTPQRWLPLARRYVVLAYAALAEASGL